MNQTESLLLISMIRLYFMRYVLSTYICRITMSTCFVNSVHAIKTLVAVAGVERCAVAEVTRPRQSKYVSAATASTTGVVTSSAKHARRPSKFTAADNAVAAAAAAAAVVCFKTIR